MKRIPSLRRMVLVLAFLPLAGFAATPSRPNIIFILTDDLGYGDVGMFFQNYQKLSGRPAIDTPSLDAMALEGMCFDSMYCPAPVCAPSRASLLTGVHQGNAVIRDNQFDKDLEANHNVATVLKQAGYATAVIGKWGLQGTGTTPATWPAYPTKRGFDYFYGYVRHVDGHEHYPREGLYGGAKQVWDNNTEVSSQLAGCYTADLWTARAKKWITDTRNASPTTPFFLYLAYDTPHAATQYPAMAYPAGGGLTGGLQWNGVSGNMINTASGVPDSYCVPSYASATYQGVAWPEVCKRYATSVTRIDRCVGDLLKLLKDLNIDDNTLIVFTSDNGPSDESYLSAGLMQPYFFASYGPFDGIKRDCWEGGVRMPLIARAPGFIPAGKDNLEPAQFHDWMPTFAELAGVPAPARTDGVSLVPSLAGGARTTPSSVYVEYYYTGATTPGYTDFEPAHRNRTRGQMQMVRLGDYVGVRYNIQGENDKFEVYNIVSDPGQSTNLAASRPDLQLALSETARKNHGVNSAAARPYDLQPVPSTRVTVSSPGLLASGFSGSFPWTPKLDGLTPTNSSVVATPATATANATLFSGYINAPASGTYTFRMSPETAALLKLDNITVIDADYGYTPGTPITTTLVLKAGKHPFRLYVKGAGSTNLQWKPPGQSALTAIPASAFSH